MEFEMLLAVMLNYAMLCLCVCVSTLFGLQKFTMSMPSSICLCLVIIHVFMKKWMLIVVYVGEFL